MSALLRIAYIINSVEGGGAALPVPSIARVIRDNGAEVEVFALTRRDGRAIAAMEASGLAVHVRDGGEKDHLAAARWLDQQMARYRPSHLWTSLTRATLLGQLVGLRRRIPVISWQHAAYLKPWNRRLLRMMQGRSALWIGDSVCVTNLTAQRLGVPPERLMMWPIFEADEAAAQASPWREGDTLKIGSLGRLHPVKGYDVLVAALALLKGKDFHPPVPFQLVIAGEGDERPRLEAAARKAGLDIVHFPGFADQPRNFLAGLHLYVQPSRSEGLCIAAHEAMQAGLPVVASAVGEMPYSIEEGVTGLVVPPADPAALAAALLSLLNDPKRLTHMGHAARVRVLDRFGTAAFAEAGRRVMQRLRTLR